MARIVLNPFGSLGDLHPYLALAVELQRRGHEAVIATSEVYRKKIGGEGVRFAAVAPNVAEFLEDPDMLARLWDPRKGTEYLFREFLIPRVRQAFEDLRPVCEGAELLLTHMGALAGPLVAQKLSIRWLSVVLQPAGFFSRYEPFVIAEAPWLRHGHRLGRWFQSLLLTLGDRRTNEWAKPIHTLREELGLAAGKNLIMAGQFSPWGTLALFSRHFAKPQPDWPPHVSQPGFLFFDNEADAAIRERLQSFLKGGPTPLLFTLGSSAVLEPGNFFEQSRRAAEILGIRAILLAGQETASITSSSDLLVLPYVPFQEVMPHVAAVVHQGGIGTLAQTLRAGRPALVVPWSHDQPDNAYRLERLGVARVLGRGQYRAERVARELRRLLETSQMRARAQELGAALRQENAVPLAANAVEAALTRNTG